ncbi:hypothetical protein Tco_0737859 [Tanacetum coccineum]
MGDVIGEGTTEGDGDMGSEPDVYSGEDGVCTGGAGGGSNTSSIKKAFNPNNPLLNLIFFFKIIKFLHLKAP